MPSALPRPRCALTAPFHPCPAGRSLARAVCFLWHFPWGRPRRTLSGTVFPWSPDFPPRTARSGAAARPADHPDLGTAAARRQARCRRVPASRPWNPFDAMRELRARVKAKLYRGAPHRPASCSTSKQERSHEEDRFHPRGRGARPLGRGLLHARRPRRRRRCHRRPRRRRDRRRGDRPGQRRSGGRGGRRGRRRHRRRRDGPAAAARTAAIGTPTATSTAAELVRPVVSNGRAGASASARFFWAPVRSQERHGAQRSVWGKLGGAGLGLPLADRSARCSAASPATCSWTARARCSAPCRGTSIFTTGLVALAAKMAKSDGVVTRSEVDAFERIVEVPQAEHARVTRLFDLAKATTDGFESYARQLADAFRGRAEAPGRRARRPVPHRQGGRRRARGGTRLSERGRRASSAIDASGFERHRGAPRPARGRSVLWSSASTARMPTTTT